MYTNKAVFFLKIQFVVGVHGNMWKITKISIQKATKVVENFQEKMKIMVIYGIQINKLQGVDILFKVIRRVGLIFHLLCNLNNYFNRHVCPSIRPLVS